MAFLLSKSLFCKTQDKSRMYLPFSRKQHRKDNTVLSASRSWYFAVPLHCISNCYIFRPDILARVSRLKRNNNNNNFSTCKWPIWWCQWINSFHSSYFNASEKGRALRRQLTCLSVRFFIVQSALIIHKICTVSQL